MTDPQPPVVLSHDQFAQLLGQLGGGNTNAGENASKSVKPVRPSIDIETTEGEYAIFEDQWSRFKRMAKLTTLVDIRDNLRQCCTDPLNKRLFDIKGAAALNNSNEDELLTWIKGIAVKGVHKEVHRTQLVKLKQKPGESINSYYGKLKAESSLCDLRVAAPATCGSADCHCVNHGVQVSYQDDLVATQLVAGLYNSEHQAKILAESADLPTLEDKLKRLMVLEKSDASLSSLNASDAPGGAATSNMVKGKFINPNKDGLTKLRRRRGPKPPPGGPKNDGPKPEGNGGCEECGKQHPQCRACKGYHKCTTRCNLCKGMGHVKNCCPTFATVSVVSAPEPTTLEEEGVVCFLVTGEEGEAPTNQEVAAQSMVKIGDSPSAMDYFSEDHSTTGAGLTVEAAAIRPSPTEYHADEAMDVTSLAIVSTADRSHKQEEPDASTGDSFSSLTMEPLLHMEYVNKEFMRSKPNDAPMLGVTCKLLVNVHARYEKFLNGERSRKVNKNMANTDGLADTGAQICTGGSDLLSALEIDVSFLVLTGMSVSGITNSKATILGALFLEISSNGRCTRQLVYIVSEARSLILSEKALKDLGVIPQNFPCAGMFGPANDAEKSAVVSTVKPPDTPSKVKNSCGCLLRTEVPPLPSKIPYSNPELCEKKLHQWILDYYAASAFNICPHQLTPTLTGPDMVITLKPGAVSVAYHSPIPVAHHWKRKVKAQIDKCCRQGVMGPLTPGTPTPWCSRLLATAKENGDPRLVVDLQALNAVSVRETHHTPSPWNLVSAIPKGVRKTILDAKDGYHAIPLAPESRPLTTFICEWGRLWFQRAPQGWTGSGDAYTKRVDEITADVDDHVRCIDDACLWKITVEDSFWHAVKYIDLCGRNGVTFNPSKFVFAAETADFAGFTVTLDSIKPTLKMTKAIKDFPTPTSITGVRSWFGLVNQVAYAFAQLEIMYPFRELLKHKKKFYWDNTLTEVFEKSKDDIIAKTENGVRIFEIDRTTCLATDFSKTGIGFLLLQKHCACTDTSNAPRCGPVHWQLIFAGSRFTKDPETRYSPIEGEALAVTFALEQSKMFVIGCPNLIVATDHKPLVPILNDKRLDLIKNPRLLALKEKTLMYRFVAQHIPGPLNFAADATSRNPCNAEAEVKASLIAIASLDDETDTSNDAEQLHTAMVNAVMAGDDDIVSWNRVKEAAAKDDSCMFICDAIENGYPQS